MVLITLLITNLIWIAYSLSEGVREGFYWHYENNSKRVCNFNINPIFNLQRALVLSIIGGFLFYTIGSFSLLSLVGMFLIFPFFHNGSYYQTRNKLDERFYPKRWMAESRTFPPFTSLISYNKRSIAMILGISSQVFIYLFLLN
jgi:hypothetical protein